MKSYRKELMFHTSTRRAYLNITPEKPYSQYDHNGYEDNADAHLKRTIMGREVVVAVTDGKLDFGPWEQIFYGEFDGEAAEARIGKNYRRIGLIRFESYKYWIEQ